MVTSLCIYRVKTGSESAFKKLLGQALAHAAEGRPSRGRPVDDLPRVGGREAAHLRRAAQLEGRNGAHRAHELPDVMAVWEPMGKLCEARDGRPAMEFPIVEPIEVPFER